MDIRQLRYFRTIAQQKNITRAAKMLNMAQPPLSQQLKQLEQELGVELVERNGRKIELTKAGEILYKRAEEMLNKMDEIQMEVREVGNGLRGILAIGMAKSCLYYLPERISYFKEHFPLVTFKILEGDPFLLHQHLQKREIELAIVRLIPLETNPNYQWISLGKEPFVFIMPKSWIHPSKTDIRMEEAAEYPLLMWHRTSGPGIYEMILNELGRYGLKPKIILEGADLTTLLYLVSCGIGATILPKPALSLFPENNIHVLDIVDSSLHSEPAVIWQKGRYLSAMAHRFIETFQI